MGKGDTSINYPSQPSYGDSMRESLEAQVALLTGTEVGDADFSQFEGGLQKLVQDYEAPLRQTTAQIDTDVLRQTLLGSQQKVVKDPETGQFGIPGAEPVTGDDGEPQTAGGGRYQILQTSAQVDDYDQKKPGQNRKYIDGTTAVYTIIDTQTGGVLESFSQEIPYGSNDSKKAELTKKALENVSAEFTKLQNTIQESDGDTDAPAREFNFTNPNTGEPLQEGDVVRAEDGMIDLLGDKRQVQETRRLNLNEQGEAFVNQNPELDALYQKAQADADPTNPFVGLSKGEAGRKLLKDYDSVEEIASAFGIDKLTLPTVASMDTGRQAGFDAQGNFLGLSALAEDIQRGNLSRQREADLADVERLSGRFQDVMEDYRPGTAEAVTGAREVLESQKDRLTGGQGQITIPTADTFGGAATPATLTAAQLGTAPTLDADTSFTAASLGTTPTLDADTSFTAATVGTAPTLDAQTSYDAASAGTAPTLDAAIAFDAASAGTAPTLQAATSYSALDPLARQALTADTSYTPSAGVTGGSFRAAQAADPMALSAATSFTPSAGVTGEGFTATAGLEGGAIAADPLRAALMTDAQTALGQGLTAREERQIAEAARARATMMGRTFDQSEAIREAEARVLEDNARRMQNRAFAQGVLGQEAGLQESDLSRGLQAAAQNQAALNQAAQFTAGQGMQAQLANQAATNEALRLGMAAGLSQEALAAQQKQAQEFANQQAQNRALEFEQNQAMQAQLANQQATNRALEFAAQAGISQEEAQARLGQQAGLTEFGAEQRRQESALQAGLAQEQAQAQFDERRALSQADLTQQASMAGLQAGLAQEQAQAGFDERRALTQAELTQQAARDAVQTGLAQEQAQAGITQRGQLAQADLTQQASQAALQAGLQQDQAQAALTQQAQRDNANLTQQAAMAGLQAGMQQDIAQAGIQQDRDILQAQLTQQGAAFGAEAAQQAALADQRQQQQANQFGVGATMDAERLNAQLAQQGALGYVDAATRLAALEDQTTMDPFAALLNRAGGGSLQAGQGVFGQANYGLSSGPQYLNPESGLGYISQMAANEASMYGAGLSADASRTAGLASGLGNLVGSGIGAFAAFCWVAREVYGPMNPQWLHFREWMFAESPRWFFNLYRKFGERFANWISDKPRIKSIIRKWMDSKIGDK